MQINENQWWIWKFRGGGCFQILIFYDNFMRSWERPQLADLGPAGGILRSLEGPGFVPGGGPGVQRFCIF